MTNLVVIGAQWGDEGKAKITDLLAENADLIVRYQGGCNAGHTVVANGKKYKFHLVPSGILYPGKICIIGSGTVINPEALAEEIKDLQEKNINLNNLYISPTAHVTLPYHIDIDSNSEKLLGKEKIGTTNKGIGPTYTDKASRIGIRVEDILDEETLSVKLDFILPQKNIVLERVYGLKPYSKEEILAVCSKYKEILSPFVTNISDILKKALKENKNILFEGAQGVMLDVDHGTYPYVTSSNPVSGGACTGSGVGPTHIDKVIGILKAYVTRVGEGPFVSELTDETGKKIQDIGQEFGTTTGRARRCGWFDAVSAKYSIFAGGITNIGLTKIDVLNDFEEIKICTAYKDTRNGNVYKDYPTNIYIHKYLEPVYETFPGWKEDISSAKKLGDLPINAQNYLKKIEELLEVPISIVSLGAKREETIIIETLINTDEKDFFIKN